MDAFLGIVSAALFIGGCCAAYTYGKAAGKQVRDNELLQEDIESAKRYIEQQGQIMEEYRAELESAWSETKRKQNETTEAANGWGAFNVRGER